MAWQASVEQTVTGLGYDLVDIERSAAGLLRITIDMPYQPGVPEQMVNVEDCEAVTRQLQFLLEVEAVDYKRLEVGSPGIDRPLKTPGDFNRFVGVEIDLTLKEPIGVTGTDIAANRKKFRGTLEAADQPDAWQIVWTDEPGPKPGQRVSKKRPPAVYQAMRFTLDELREARLAPIVDFKGRKPKAAAEQPDSATDVAE
ncbi:MAG: ribosome maturation factor RimP [Burkholderiaceae bacterium]